MGQTTRTRVETLQRANTEYGTFWPSLPAFNQDFHSSGTVVGTQVTVSEGHPWGALGRTDADLGGEFFSSRCKAFSNSPYIEVRSPLGVFQYYFKGRIYPVLDASVADVTSFLPLDHSSVSEIDSLGSTAIAHTVPTNPVAGLSVTFGELREGFPKLMGTLLFKQGLKKLLQGSADEFLNYQFGIKPLINDLKKWAYAYSHADKLWDQFLKDSGKRVRRHYAFPKSREVLISNVTPGQPAQGTGISAVADLWQGGQNSFDLFQEHVLERERWFSGCFTYFVEVDKSLRNEWKLHRRRMDYLFGTNFSPQAIWNLAPWSWAADWFANTGSLITNITRFSEDGLVMPYGYMMELSSLRNLYRMRNVTPIGYNIPDLTQVLSRTVKYRRRATPYGFGLDASTFSTRQWAILGALGLSRLR